MKVLILGGTGFIGKHLNDFLSRQRHEVQALGRTAFEEDFDLVSAVNGQDAIVMLAGENIGKRWSEKYKEALLTSRVDTSQQLKQAIELCHDKPKRILTASAIGIYPENDCQHPIDESTELGRDNFLAKLGQAWEQQNSKLNPKPVVMRFGVVLGKSGGALAKMLPAFKLGFGGPIAGGKQCFSWIHIQDLLRAIEYLIKNPQLEGAFNLTAPTPLTQEDFGQTLANVLSRPYFMPMPLWLLKWLFGEGAQVLTHSSAVLPKRLLDEGFTFEFTKADSALENLLHGDVNRLI